jgi:glycosyltransferase involved in cell wall biosynthesis
VTATPSVAIVHDYLTQRGGAERVVLALHDAFPDAPVHTSLYDPEGTYPEFAAVPVVVGPLDRIGALRHHHRLALPLLAPSFSSRRIDADVVVCSSSGWAHGVRTEGAKVVYCHAPARWLYQRDAYLDRAGPATRAATAVLTPPLRRWDRRAAASADRYLANSTRTRQLVRDAYGFDAEIVFPPHGAEPDAPQQPVAGLEPGFFLCVSRLLPYKHVGAVVEAFRGRPERLVVVGAGPEREALVAGAPANVSFLADVSDASLRWLYAHAAALVAAAFEDFGLTPLEAAAFGTPSIVLRFGGYLDTVVEGETGWFFDAPSPGAVAAALDRFDPDDIAVDRLREHAARFGPDRFAATMRDVVARAAAGR